MENDDCLCEPRARGCFRAIRPPILCWLASFFFLRRGLDWPADTRDATAEAWLKAMVGMRGAFELSPQKRRLDDLSWNREAVQEEVMKVSIWEEPETSR